MEEPSYSTVVRSDPYPDKPNRFLTIIDSEEKSGLKPEDFRKFFNGKGFVVHSVGCNADIVEGDHITTEAGDLHSHYIVVDVKITFVWPRICGNTLYTFWNYKGKKDEHLILFSSIGCEHMMTNEYLGNNKMNGKVLVENDISGYFIRPSASGGCHVTYTLLNDTTGTPDFAFKKFGI